MARRPGIAPDMAVLERLLAGEEDGLLWLVLIQGLLGSTQMLPLRTHFEACLVMMSGYFDMAPLCIPLLG